MSFFSKVGSFLGMIYLAIICVLCAAGAVGIALFKTAIMIPAYAVGAWSAGFASMLSYVGETHDGIIARMKTDWDTIL